MPDAIEAALEWRGHDMIDPDGDKVGTIQEIYVDQETELPEWALVRTGLLGTRSNFVPLAAAEAEGDVLRVPYSKDHVREAPSVEPDGELSPEEEESLYRYYDLRYGGPEPAEDASGDAPPEGAGDADASEPATDTAMTRSEEELTVGKSQREAGRVRLRKYVVTEQVTKTVPLEREEVRIEREPITDANPDPALAGRELSEEEHELTLHEEELVVEKRVVPKERIRLDKETVVEQTEVSEELRKEQIELDEREGPGP